MIRISVDGMGGDFAPKTICEGSMQALQEYSNIEITIFGDASKMDPFLKPHDRLKIVHTEHFLDMAEKEIMKLYKTNKEISMFKAMQYVKDGFADAFVTAGPTQAVVLAGHFIIKRMKHMKRVAIAPIIPSYDMKGRILLDSGANIDFKAEQLVEFALYASIVVEKVLKRPHPKVALINIGTEDVKGRELELELYQLLKNNDSISFSGNMEPKEIFTHEADIFLTDGFTGNIVMKTMEGTAKGLGMNLKREIKSGFFSKLGALMMKPALLRYKKSMDASEIGGALLMGFEHVVIKAHGSSDGYALKNAIRQAKEMVEADVINEVKKVLEKQESSAS
jgi:glycerol-3-phosphate acyltransferase PlsX